MREILARLEATLSVPSEWVQRSVADVLPPLVGSLTEDERRALMERLLAALTGGLRYGDRRGAAFGLAAVVKGLGISAVKAYGIVDALRAGLESGSPAAREGSLMAFECLCARLGRLFEPYVVNLMTQLVACFGDGAAEVRDAGAATAAAVMALLSGPGVKLVLPALLKGLDERVWRTKQGSVQMLGAMAHCAPKQLSACLPAIVPRLSDVLSDTHPKVQASARDALHEIGSVIRNPEIAALVPVILDAIIDPNGRTAGCLDTLLDTTFVNSVDAPSLALIVPIIVRGLRERKTELKKKAAKIAGNMCALVTSPADMAPYVPLLLPELKKALLDPIPEVRAIAARALASLLQGMGESHFADLMPWLQARARARGPPFYGQITVEPVQEYVRGCEAGLCVRSFTRRIAACDRAQATLASESSSAERSGASQGLAEALAVLGPGHVAALVPDIVAGCAAPRAAVREGYLTLVRFLPATLGAVFQPHLGEVLVCVLNGLSDEAEGARDAALAAGRVLARTPAALVPAHSRRRAALRGAAGRAGGRVRAQLADAAAAGGGVGDHARQLAHPPVERGAARRAAVQGARARCAGQRTMRGVVRCEGQCVMRGARGWWRVAADARRG